MVKIKQSKKPETRTKVDFLFERAEPTFYPKSQLIKLAQKVRKSQLFDTDLDPNK